MKDYLQEIGNQVKLNAEGQGRTEANLCDMLNTAYDYGMTQQHLTDHLEKGELTLTPMQTHLATHADTL